MIATAQAAEANRHVCTPVTSLTVTTSPDPDMDLSWPKHTQTPLPMWHLSFNHALLFIQLTRRLPWPECAMAHLGLVLNRKTG
jgi:hypothetical protein